MFRGINVGNGDTAAEICKHCYQNGLIIETSGGHDEVVKVLAPLTIPMEQFEAGLEILAKAADSVMSQGSAKAA